ncbi:MAG: T9SS type A sorting domain-containing protein [Fibrobacteria bacterium]|nr:T9SS type A sorting domain-containing protein [Fibrobacteria bacterium]
MGKNKFVRMVLVVSFFFLLQLDVFAIKAMGYNIGCYSGLSFENSHLNQMVQGIIDEKADLVGLTEVALNYGNSGGVTKNWATYIVARLKSQGYEMHSYTIATFGWEGMLLLSRYPIKSQGVHTIDPVTQMKVGRLTVDVQGTDVHFFMTHVWPHKDMAKRVTSVTSLLNYTNGYSGVKIMTGDFNTAFNEPAVTMVMDAGWLESGQDFLKTQLPTVSTSESGIRPPGKGYQIDFIFIKKAFYTETHVPYSNTNLANSDHWPIVATVSTGSTAAKNVIVTTDGVKVDLTWDAILGLGGVKYYRVARDGTADDNEIGYPAESSYTDSTVQAGNTYTYYIQAKGNDGDSEWSSGVKITVNVVSVASQQKENGITINNFAHGNRLFVGFNSLNWMHGDISVNSPTGKQLLRKTIQKQKMVLDLSAYQSGVYLLQFKKDARVSQKKIILQNF